MTAHTASTAPKSSNSVIAIVLLVLAVAAVVAYAGVHAVAANSVVTKQAGAASGTDPKHPSLTIEKYHSTLPWLSLGVHPAVEK